MIQRLLKTENDPCGLKIVKKTKTRATLNFKVVLSFEKIGPRKCTVKVDLCENIHRYLTVIFGSLGIPVNVERSIKFSSLENYPLDSYIVSIAYLKNKNRAFIPVYRLEFHRDLLGPDEKKVVPC